MVTREEAGRASAADNCLGFPAQGASPCCALTLHVHTSRYRCCNSCEDVREAYRRRGWAFKNPDTIEQCRREGFSQKMQEQKNEGCQVYGFLEVNKVPGGKEARRAGLSQAGRTPQLKWRMRGNIPCRWLETSTLPLGRASNSPMCMVSDPESARGI